MIPGKLICQTCRDDQTTIGEYCRLCGAKTLKAVGTKQERYYATHRDEILERLRQKRERARYSSYGPEYERFMRERGRK